MTALALRALGALIEKIDNKKPAVAHRNGKSSGGKIIQGAPLKRKTAAVGGRAVQPKLQSDSSCSANLVHFPLILNLNLDLYQTFTKSTMWQTA